MIGSCGVCWAAVYARTRRDSPDRATELPGYRGEMEAPVIRDDRATAPSQFTASTEMSQWVEARPLSRRLTCTVRRDHLGRIGQPPGGADAPAVADVTLLARKRSPETVPTNSDRRDWFLAEAIVKFEADPEAKARAGVIRELRA